MKLKPLFIVLLGLFFTTTFYWVLSCFENQKVPSAPIRSIAQTGPVKEGLKTEYFAEILQLSADTPKPLDPEEAETILRKSPIIKEVEVSLINPETLYIDYTLRQPTYLLADFSNMALDETGVPFPLSPYFTPKNLPELILGLKEGAYIPQDRLELVNHLIKQVGDETLISRIDLTHIEEDSLGKREIILVIENEHTLRLTPKRYQEEIAHYLALREQLESKSTVIDLRIPNLAYIAKSL